MRAALEALPGVSRIEMDLARDLFRVTGGDRDAVVDAIRSLGYDPSPAGAGEFRGGRPDHPTGAAPPALAEALERAGREDRLVLVDCHAPM